MKVKTDIETLKNVWNLLKELELHTILDSNDYNFKLVEIIDQLLVNNKLTLFCQIVTGSDEDFNKKEIAEVITIISDFFHVTAATFKPLVAVIAEKVNADLSNMI